MCQRLPGAIVGFVDWFLGLPEPLAWLAFVAVMALEMGMILHFLPTELILMLGTLRLAHDLPSLVLVVLVATFASTAGCLLPYGVARYGGRPLVLRFSKPLHLTPARLAKFEHVMAGRGGKWLVFLCRALPGLRTAPSIPAGLAKMEASPFILLSAVGCGLFNALFAGLTYLYGKPVVERIETGLERVRDTVVGHPLAAALALLILVLGLVAVVRWFRRRRPAAPVVVESAPPTPPEP